MTININKVLFCIDASTFITMDKYYPPNLLNDLWVEFDILFDQGKIISHRFVFEELTTKAKYKDHIAKWISTKWEYFKDISEFQIQYVSQIIKKFPGLIDANCEKDQADPWIIALAIEMEREPMELFKKKQMVFVVSEENKNSSIKIPAVAKYYGLSHLNLIELCKLLGWHFTLNKI
jgi:hypothetical protein